MKKLGIAALLLAMAFAFAGCGGSGSEGGDDEQTADKTEVKVFAAASMQSSLEELEKSFEAENPDVDILLNCDSSGTLMTQIEEGAPCDVFFSAAQKQMDELEEQGLVKEGTRQNVLNNQLVVITQPDSDTAVTGLENLKDAKSIALADGSVPVGKYTRQALINLKILPEADDPAAIATQEVSDALGGVEISEQGNVSKVLTAVEEGSCEVGTVYLSDTYGHEDSVKIIEKVPYEVTGDIIYPIALINNPDGTVAEVDAAEAVLDWFTGDDAKALYQEHLFDTNVE
ncbi:MAG: molybdate ABC transporter substrate-binding protein [Firmicutes bacterium]|nr:molybdate ABC transporter substrate-binding protein [Bacillota bacterium]